MNIIASDCGRCGGAGLALRRVFCRRLLPLLALCYLLGWSAPVAALRVGFLCPDPPDSPFWGEVVRVMHAAAEDLDVDLVVAYGKGGTYSSKKVGNELLDLEPRLDYLLTGYWLSSTLWHLQRARELGIKVFIFNAEIIPSDQSQVGQPRQIFKNWIGHMTPNDDMASRALAEILIARARQASSRTSDGKIHVAGLTGNDDNQVSVDRRDGLQRVIADNRDLLLSQPIDFAQWDRNVAESSTAKILKKDPQVSVLWTAADTMALGSLDVIEKNGLVPGRDIFVGGFDWTPEGIAAVEAGRLTASMGGHFLEGAWALILVHDYHYGIDFADDPGLRIRSDMHAITKAVLPQYREFVLNRDWSRFDFRQFSKKYNPNLKKYNFDIEQFMQ